MNTTKRGNVRYQIKSRKGEVKSEVNKEKENAEKRKEKKKLKENVDCQVFQDDEELLSEEKQHLREKGNSFEDEKLFYSNSSKVRKYHFRSRQQSKEDTTERVRLKKNVESNHLGNEIDVNNVNQCKYGNENGKQNYNLD